MNKQVVIRDIKTYVDKNGQPYNYINVSGGRMKLEDAPLVNLLAMRSRLLSRPLSKLKPKEDKQLTLAFIKL